MPTPAELDQFIAAHGMWKARLRQVLASGRSETPVATIRRDDQCDFGRWLHGASPADRRAPEYQSIKTLHARFHVAASRVVELALAGRRAEAEASMAMGGEYFQASVELTNAMKGWKRAIAA